MKTNNTRQALSISLRKIKDSVISIRKKKFTDPKGMEKANSGSNLNGLKAMGPDSIPNIKLNSFRARSHLNQSIYFEWSVVQIILR